MVRSSTCTETEDDVPCPAEAKSEKASREQRRANEFAIMQQRDGTIGRMSYKEAVELMHGQHEVLMQAGGQMHVHGAGVEADGAEAEAEAPGYRRCRCA